MLDLGWEISFSFIPLGQCKRLQWCRCHLKIENSTKYLCYIYDPDLAFTEICPCQWLLGGGFQTKRKITFETTRGISAQPSSSLSSHSTKESMYSWAESKDRTCENRSHMLELGVGDGGVPEHGDSKHFSVPDRKIFMFFFVFFLGNFNTLGRRPLGWSSEGRWAHCHCLKHLRKTIIWKYSGKFPFKKRLIGVSVNSTNK